MASKITFFCLLSLSSSVICTNTPHYTVTKVDDIVSSSHTKLIQAEDNALDLTVNYGGNSVLTGKLGLGSPSVVGQAVSCSPDPGFQDCYKYGDYAKLQLSSGSDDNCTRFVWSSTHARLLEDCFDIVEGVHWYGGGETYLQHWPIENIKRNKAPMVTGDYLSGHEFGSLTESYWVVSSGVAIHGEEDVPLFITWGSGRADKVCFVAEDKWPYKTRSDKLELKYNICTGSNMKDVHLKTVKQFYPVPPKVSPDANMLLRPFWSTWAQYHADVNQTLVMEYAQRLIQEGFTLNSHIEIDDDWETCYGEHEFNTKKFPNASEMVRQLKALNLKVTLWIHPFINFNCPSFQTAVVKKYFVQDENGKLGLTGWWQDKGLPSGIIDFTNPEAVAWWSARIESLRVRYGIDSFKFDAGEANWLPRSVKLNGDVNLQPNLFSTKYVEAMAKFGGMVEVRTGRQNQNEGIFTRMLDKDSRWGYDNGLQSLIPTLLHFGIVGYPFVLPDMIGGNAYGSRPSPELYIRWMQANAFMPAVQFSLVPWDFGPEAVQVSKDMLALREKYSSLLYKAVEESLVNGSPINRPMWWVDPKDSMTYTIDSQYMLGDDILVAPVLIEGATSRNIYLPRGQWVDLNGVTYEGPTTLTDFPAPIDSLPYFIKESTASLKQSTDRMCCAAQHSLLRYPKLYSNNVCYI